MIPDAFLKEEVVLTLEYVLSLLDLDQKSPEPPPSRGRVPELGG